MGLESALLRELIIYFHLNHISGYDLVPRDAEDAGPFGRTDPWTGIVPATMDGV